MSAQDARGPMIMIGQGYASRSNKTALVVLWPAELA